MSESETNRIVGENELERPPRELEVLNFGNQEEQQEDRFQQDLGPSNSKNSTSKSSGSTEMSGKKKLMTALEEDEDQIQETQSFDSPSKSVKQQLTPLEKYENSRNLNKIIWDRSFKNK